MNERASVRITDDLRGRITGTVNAIIKRRHWVIPFPLDTDDPTLLGLVRSVVPDHIADAIEVLALDKVVSGSRLMQDTGRAYLYVNDKRMLFDFDKSYFIIDAYSGGRDYKTVEPSHPQYAVLDKWTDEVMALKERCDKATAALYTVLNFVTTSGQLKRAWPELIPLLPNNIQSRLGNAQRVSRLPLDFQSVTDVHDLKDASELLALLSMYPEGTTYPKVSV